MVGAIVRRALATATVGVVLGIVGGVATTHMLATFLFGVAPLDPATFGAVAVIVAVAAATAAYLPARRAARVDPSFTLREE